VVIVIITYLLPTCHCVSCMRPATETLASPAETRR